MKRIVMKYVFLTFFALFFTSRLFSQEVVVNHPGKLKDPQKPLVDEPEKLIPLAPNGEIWITEDKKSVVFNGMVCLNQGVLEFFLCSTNTKEYESVVSTSVKPYIIHAGLLTTGIEPGTPVKHTPEYEAPTGPTIDVKVRWLDKEGKRQEQDAREWIQDAKTKKSMEPHWVFTGSLFQKLNNGKMRYLADSTGEIIGVANFPTVVLDVPIESTDKNEALLFQAFTKNIPDPETPVTLILTPKIEEKTKEQSESESREKP